MSDLVFHTCSYKEISSLIHTDWNSTDSCRCVGKPYCHISMIQDPETQAHPWYGWLVFKFRITWSACARRSAVFGSDLAIFNSPQDVWLGVRRWWAEISSRLPDPYTSSRVMPPSPVAHRYGHLNRYSLHPWNRWNTSKPAAINLFHIMFAFKVCMYCGVVSCSPTHVSPILC